MSKRKRTQQPRQAPVTPAPTRDIAGGKPGHPAWLLLGVIALLLLIIGVYLPSMHGQFLMDDEAKILFNPDIRDWNHLGAKLIHRYEQSRTYDEKVQAFQHNDPSRPVVFWTFALNYHFGKLDVFGYHLVNVLLHCFNTLLLWLLSFYIWRLLFNKQSLFFSWLVAAIFALHPINTGTVSYIFSRSDLLATFFFLLALLLFYATFRGERRRYGLYALSLVCFILSLCSKQSSATFPLAMLAFDVMLVSNFSLDGLSRRKFLHLGYWLMLAGYLIARYCYFGQMGDLEAWAPWPAYNYAITQPFSLVKYLQLLLVPVGLCLDHGIDAAQSIAEPKILLSMLVVIALGVGVYRAYRKRTEPNKLVLFYAAWFVLAIAPTSTFLPTTAVLVENRMYLPGVAWAGLFVLVYYLLWQAATRRGAGWRAAVLALIILHLGILSAVTFVHNGIFQTKEKMWLDVDRLYPDRDRTQTALASVYYFEKHDNDKALARYEELVSIDNRAHKLVPRDSYHNIGAIYYKKGNLAQGEERKAYLDKAEEAFKNELALYPDSSATLKDLANMYYCEQRLAEAEKEYRECLRLDPKNEQACYEVGCLYQNSGRITDAMAVYQQALALNPGDIAVLDNCASLYAVQNQEEKAITMFQHVLKLDAHNQQAGAQLMMIYRKLNQPEKAAAVARQLQQ